MNLRSLALAPVLALALALPAAAEKIPLDEISRYLNSFRTAGATFKQVNADGSTSAGKLYIQRPNRVRFEYGKDKTVVLASAGQVAVFDGKSNQPHQEYPLSRTPLSIILADNVNLGRANMVTGVGEYNGMTVVQAQDPAHPQNGNIQLFFSPNPTQLRQWVITDDTGKKTSVVLDEMHTGVEIRPSAFSIQAEVQRR